jgi:hypothetical protein
MILIFILLSSFSLIKSGNLSTGNSELPDAQIHDELCYYSPDGHEIPPQQIRAIGRINLPFNHLPCERSLSSFTYSLYQIFRIYSTSALPEFHFNKNLYRQLLLFPKHYFW